MSSETALLGLDSVCCKPLTCSVECAVLVGVQPDHLANGPHIVPQHDALSLHHEEVCGGWKKTARHFFNHLY